MTNLHHKICTGIVCYKPDYLLLSSIINYFQEQGVTVVLYLNSDLDKPRDFLLKGVVVLGTGDNDGIAKAHSELMRYAITHSYNYMVVSDQDTVYPENYISSMKEFVDSFKGVSVVCPAWINLNSNDNYPEKQYVLETDRMVLKHAEYGDNLAHGISSGMFVVLERLTSKQYIDEELFIDWVDNDFCWSLISSGHSIRYNARVSLSHNLGDKVKTIGRVKFTTRPPIRDYYIVRNSLFLILYRRYKIKVKSYLFVKFFSHIILSLISSKSLVDFKERFCLLSKAIYHSLIKKLGSL
jgi:rhamnosyltransferase